MNDNQGFYTPIKIEGGQVKYDPNPGREPRTVTLARVTIQAPHLLDKADRRAIANWMVCLAQFLDAYGPVISEGRYRARYFGTARTRALASVNLRGFSALSVPTQKRIANWLLSRAKWLRKHSRTCGEGRWWTQEFSL